LPPSFLFALRNLYSKDSQNMLSYKDTQRKFLLEDLRALTPDRRVHNDYVLTHEQYRLVLELLEDVLGK
jgi:uncharacterized protein YjiK